MKKGMMTTGALGTLLTMFVMFHSTAHAYIDPGTGSILLQAIVGGVFAILLAVKVFWSKIKGYCSSFAGNKKESGEDHDQ